MGVKTLFTSPIKRWGKRALDNNRFVQRIFHRVLTSDYATRMLLTDNTAMLDLVSHSDFGKSDSHVILEQFLLEKMLLSPALHPRIVEWLNTQPRLVEELLSLSQLKRMSDRDSAYIASLIKHHNLYEDLVDREILEELFKYDETLDYILDNYLLRERLLFDERAIDRIVADPRYLEVLLTSGDVLHQLLHDERLQDALVAHTDILNDLLKHSSIAKAIANDPALQGTLSACFDTEYLLAILSPEQMLKRIEPETIGKHLGPDGLFAALDTSELAGRIKLADLLEEIDPNGRQFASYLDAHPTAVRTISMHQEAVKHFLSTPEFRDNLRLLEGVERASKLPYLRPAVVVCYPRSGSNFMQSILIHSTGMQNVSIYTNDPGSYDPLLTVKSHALSPDYLRDEYERLLKIDALPERIILIKRDPRDVMISFYEYTQKQRETTISQEEFLEKICFFYASTIDKTYSRHVDKAPMSILDAYKKHVQEWFIDRPSSVDALEIAYEDLVLHPRETFRTTLDYLDLDLPVAESYLDVKVSQYSDARRTRGVAYNWMHSDGQYAILLEGVERLLSKEIKALGYDSVHQSEPPPSTDSRTPKAESKKAKSSSKKHGKGTGKTS